MNFPQGPGFEQERCIEAFRGLTQMMAAGRLQALNSYWIDIWEEMFNELAGREKPDA